MTLLVGSLFYLLSPGILLRFPKNGSKMAVAATHAVIFAILYYFIHNVMWNFVNEGFKGVDPPPVVVPAKGVQSSGVVVSQKKAGFADYF